jgi:hypothetical protein
MTPEERMDNYMALFRSHIDEELLEEIRRGGPNCSDSLAA